MFRFQKAQNLGSLCRLYTLCQAQSYSFSHYKLEAYSCKFIIVF